VQEKASERKRKCKSEKELSRKSERERERERDKHTNPDSVIFEEIKFLLVMQPNFSKTNHLQCMHIQLCMQIQLGVYAYTVRLQCI